MRPAQPPRTAELVLVTADGKPVGVPPPVPVATPWWQEVEPVVQAARQHHGVEIVVLRLIDTEREDPHGGRVTYPREDGRSARRPAGGLPPSPP